MQGSTYFRIPGLTISAGSQVDVSGAAQFTAATLNAQQLSPCIVGSSGSSSVPAFCSDFAAATGQPPVLCATPSFSSFSQAIYQCSGIGATFEVVFSNPGDSCSGGNLPASAVSSLDSWWRFQLNQLADGVLVGKLFNGTTTGGTASQPKVSRAQV